MMMSSLSLITAMSEYVITCDGIYSDLEDFIGDFEDVVFDETGALISNPLA